MFCSKDSYIENYDIAVIGAGHAGIEASLAAARLGCSVIIFTINMDAVGNCPCNPSIGGTAKGHLVREIDALGGEMAKTADNCSLQSRLLNRGKGPAVHSLRAQIDRRRYSEIMKHKLEREKNLYVRQAEIVEIARDIDKNFYLKSNTGIIFRSKSVILATGTYLGGKIFIGESSFNGGPDGIFPAMFLKKSLENLGIKFRRFKTGTPARALKSSLDFSKMQIQFGDREIIPFSFETDSSKIKNLEVCHITWTNARTKKIILNNLHRSILYSKEIKAIGPRYCPSIEDKIIRFKEKTEHQIFVEPCGLNTDEMYLQGLSTSLPEDAQIKLYSTIAGFENITITRPAYAIEYDCVDPLQLNSILEFKEVPLLFCSGQIAGSSGYEEAAAQGLIAGINAARKILGKTEVVLDRQSSYVGILINDMTTKGVSDPYRMMTSRAEYRLILRQDNADERLTPMGRNIGLISDERWENFQNKLEIKKSELKRISKIIVPPSERINGVFRKINTSEISTGIRLADLLKRPEINYKILEKIELGNNKISGEILDQIQIEIKYEGYIKRQLANIKKIKRQSLTLIPSNIKYNEIIGLRLEAREKLSKIKPSNIQEASTISGVNPADISVLIVWINKLENCRILQNKGLIKK
ncbi:MAG: tRNA uridine-5-carboxymethylaminomethyl(34) synthesis enzyme MnmG [Oscillospiraceae bacterium]|nr:tRNA uridine-5-carboxymethylaminomethyl(34) synthesis enzyme MnmG [Oscillospiraceae bacterium]